MSKSKQYWLDRMLDRDKAAKLSEDKLLEELNRYYTDSYIAIEKELNNFYVKYATENGISYNQARKILTPKDIREYSSKIGGLKKLYAETKDINVYLKMQEIGSRANVTRLQSLLDSIDIELIKSANNTQISIEQHLSNMYKRSYKQALEDIGTSNKAINSRAVKEALGYPWSGMNFSERIWGNNTKIFNTMQETITRGIIQGKSVPNVAKDIKRLSNQVFKKEKTLREMEKIHRYNAERLVRTETNHFMTKGHIDGYRESGVVKAVEICVHWDERTCPDCESMDREVIPLNEVSYGSNVPPFHAFCRCTVVPVIKEDNIKNSGATYGAYNDDNDTYGLKRDNHAEMYYESVRNRDKYLETKTIARNTGFKEKDIEKVYNHVFVNKYKLDGGFKRFDPDYDMACSWARLREGKNIQEHDIIMLKHERLEYNLMKRYNLSYRDAHDIVESKYNYRKATDAFNNKKKGV